MLANLPEFSGFDDTGDIVGGGGFEDLRLNGGELAANLLQQLLNNDRKGVSIEESKGRQGMALVANVQRFAQS